MVTEVKYGLNQEESKIISLLISKIDKNDSYSKYRFNTKELLNLTGLEKLNNLQELTKSLLRKVLEFKEEDSEYAMGLLCAVEYFEDEDLVDMRFEPNLKPFLLELKKEFSNHEREIILRLKSIYSIRFYHLLKLKNTNQFRLTINELKKLLKVDNSNYSRYSDFKKRIILTTQKELKEKANLYFEFSEFKIARKIHAIDFTIIEKNEEIELPEPIEVIQIA